MRNGCAVCLSVPSFACATSAVSARSARNGCIGATVRRASMRLRRSCVRVSSRQLPRRHGVHFLRGAVGIQPNALRGRQNESHARVREAVQGNLQQQVVRRHGHDSLSQQEGSVCGENRQSRPQLLFRRLHGRVRCCSARARARLFRASLVDPRPTDRPIDRSTDRPTATDVVRSCDYDKAIKFIQEKFLAQNENPRKLIYPNVTCATDTKNIQVVFTAVQDIVVRNAIGDHGHG